MMRFARNKGKFVFSLGVLCVLAMPVTNAFGQAGGIYCPDGSCNFGETCESCEMDCGPCEPAIPTVSEWGLIVMTLLALTAGTIVFGRRRRAAMA